MLNSIKPTYTLAGVIAIYEDVWDDLAEDLITISNISSDQESEVYFSKGKVKSEQVGFNSEIEKVRTNYSLSLKKASEVSLDLKNINEKFNKVLDTYLSNYRLMFNINETFFYTESNSLLKYTDSQYYKAHYDGDTSSRRVVSPILYLNENYEGGEIEFVNFGIKIKPKAGSLLVFPSNYAYRHIAHPVTSGEKYAIVTWIHDC